MIATNCFIFLSTAANEEPIEFSNEKDEIDAKFTQQIMAGEKGNTLKKSRPPRTNQVLPANTTDEPF